ncbi:MAG: heme-binding protein [Bacteroidales bacterium]|nr:heme-binding protein [Bacteroidales bacterium]
MATEKRDYETLYQSGDIEIRKYESAIFASVRVKGSMFENKNQNFRTLAGYIFGGNDQSEKISMTSPVTMKGESDSARMSFMMPSEYRMEDLPDPNGDDIDFSKQEGFYAVTIRFGGYSDAESYENHKQKLIKFCRENNLDYTDDVSLLGYDPPFKFIGRRNEVMIKLKDYPGEFLQNQ